jgi:rare lipoprotein A
VNKTLVALLAAALMFAGCANQPSSSSSRYHIDQDVGPEHEIDLSHVPDAVPRVEPRTRAGNKNPYTVLGKTYYLIEDETHYQERGDASWYGKKFHGHKTSNGEVYDMYAMTAAHKTLPIPSYVRVTHLGNHRSVVVRVNDRGPFHPGRIIDLSYAAAQRLGITQTGTGPVEVEIIVPGDTPPPPLKPDDRPASHSDGMYLQVGAFAQQSGAQRRRDTIAAATGARVFISEFAAAKPLYRVRIGPLANLQQVQQVRDELAQAGIADSHLVK